MWKQGGGKRVEFEKGEGVMDWRGNKGYGGGVNDAGSGIRKWSKEKGGGGRAEGLVAEEVIKKRRKGGLAR